MIITMNTMRVGEKGRVREVACCGEIKRRLLDIGLICGTEIECVLKSAFGSTKAYLIRGAVIAVRAEDCAGVALERCEGTP